MSLRFLLSLLASAVAGAGLYAVVFSAGNAGRSTHPTPAASQSGPDKTEVTKTTQVNDADGTSAEARAKADRVALKIRRERNRLAAEVKRLKAQVAQLKSIKTDPAGDKTKPKKEDLIADIKARAKEGLRSLLTLDENSDLLKSLRALDQEGIQLVADLLSSGSNADKLGAAALMVKLKDDRFIPHLEKAALAEENAENVLLQRLSTAALAGIGGEKAVPGLERLFKSEKEWGVRMNAGAALAEMGRSDAIEWIGTMYDSADDETKRLGALSAMSRVGDPTYLPVLHKVLTRETEYSKRYLAMVGIAKAAREDSLPILESIINRADEDKMIVSEAKKAYDEIVGEP